MSSVGGHMVCGHIGQSIVQIFQNVQEDTVIVMAWSAKGKLNFNNSLLLLNKINKKREFYYRNASIRFIRAKALVGNLVRASRTFVFIISFVLEFYQHTEKSKP
jgi:hypothetical protein